MPPAFGAPIVRPTPQLPPPKASRGAVVASTEHLETAPAPWQAAGASLTAPSSVFLNNVVQLRGLKRRQPVVEQAVNQQLSSFVQQLGVSDRRSLQDVCAAMSLSESVYKAEDFGGERATQAIHKLQHLMPAGAPLHNISFSPPSQRQRYVVAESADAIYIAFLGTKRAGDHISNLDLRHVPLPGVPPRAAGADGKRRRLPAAHSGYLKRAAGVPVEQLYQLAAVAGKRLVLAGHSLGGAVAVLAGLRLLAALPPSLAGTVSCVTFATPPIGNAELAEAVAAAGWNTRIKNYMLPEDWVPGVLTFWTGSPRLRRSNSAPDGLSDPPSDVESARSSLDGSVSSEDEEAPLHALRHSASAPALIGAAAEERVCCGTGHQCVCGAHGRQWLFAGGGGAAAPGAAAGLAAACAA